MPFHGPWPLRRLVYSALPPTYHPTTPSMHQLHLFASSILVTGIPRSSLPLVVCTRSWPFRPSLPLPFAAAQTFPGKKHMAASRPLGVWLWVCGSSTSGPSFWPWGMVLGGGEVSRHSRRGKGRIRRCTCCCFGYRIEIGDNRVNVQQAKSITRARWPPYADQPAVIGVWLYPRLCQRAADRR
jgi:hypothetical protein